MLFANKEMLTYPQRLRRLRYLSAGFVLLLFLPLAGLLYFGYQQLQTTVLNEFRDEAANLVRIINRKIYKKISLGNGLPASAFDYYQQVYNPVSQKPEQLLSPLSKVDLEQLGSEQQISGLLGYFQYDSKGNFSSPIWPQLLTAPQPDASLTGDTTPNLSQRQAIAINLHSALAQSTVIQHMLQQGLQHFIGRFDLVSDLPSYLIFYRVIEDAGQHKLQGYLVERQAYLAQIFTDVLELRHFNRPVLVELSDRNGIGSTLYFNYEKQQGSDPKIRQPSHADQNLQQQPIYRSSFLWPFTHYTLSVSTDHLPATPAMLYSGAFALVLIIAIMLACYGLYRLGVKQLLLAEQRLNFVSSVSHELKTPVTSIRMYAEMLKEGMAPSLQTQKDYYQFIFSESERLSRLINNVLQLSQLNQIQSVVQPRYVELLVLQDTIRSQTASLLANNGFNLHLKTELLQPEQMQLLVDPDAFAQVIINITDNAVKFFDRNKISDAKRQKLDFIFRLDPQQHGTIQLEIRDYGDGIAVGQEKKIFGLFYRGGSELTRTTQGTGIGLALVQELVVAQGGEIKVERRKPGLALVLSFQFRQQPAKAVAS